MYLFSGVSIVRDETKLFHTWCTNFFILTILKRKEKNMRKLQPNQKDVAVLIYSTNQKCCFFVWLNNKETLYFAVAKAS